MSESVLAVIGAGAWGTALAVHLGRGPRVVRLWVREPGLAVRMRERRDNPMFLPGVVLPGGVWPTGSIEESLAGAELVLAVVPSHHARGIYRAMAPVLDPTQPLVVATKGIEEGSLALPLDVAREELGAARGLAVLSGPSFAGEVAHGKATALVVASTDDALNRRVQELLGSPTLRVYTSDDPRGVQLAGALKNVIAIAAGVADALGMGANAQAALITRGLAEIERLGHALGCSAPTFSGLAGLGDLVLTCTGEQSRNRQLGQRIGRGESLDAIVGSTITVAEGVRTTRSARELARRAGVEMPIVDELHRLLFEGGDAATALGRLMNRPATAERA